MAKNLYRLSWHELGECCTDAAPTPHKPHGAAQVVASRRFAEREAAAIARRVGANVYAHSEVHRLEFLAYDNGEIYDARSGATRPL